METTFESLNIKDITKMVMRDYASKIDYLQELATRGDVVRVRGPKSHFFVNDPDIIHQVMVSNESNYTKAETSIMRTRSILDVGQLTNYGDDWAMGRKKLQGNFYHKNLEQVFEVINLKVDKMLNNWAVHCANRKPINLMETMCALTLEIGAAVLFGRDAPYDFVAAVRRFRFANDYVVSSRSLSPLKPTIGNYRFQRARHIARKMTIDLLEGPHNDYPNLNPLLEPTFLTGNESEEERQWAIGQGSNFFLASHDTTASLIAWLYYLLHLLPEQQNDLIKEVQQVLGQQPPSFDNYQNLNFTRQLIQETLRMYPPVWVIERRAIEEDQFGPFTVPEDANVIICPYTIHRHPDHWDNPHNFDPRRFDKNRSQDRPKCAYLPFGTGPRVCTGQNLAMIMAISIVAKIAQRFYLTLANKAPIYMDPLLTLKSTPDVMVKILEID